MNPYGNLAALMQLYGGSPIQQQPYFPARIGFDPIGNAPVGGSLPWRTPVDPNAAYLPGGMNPALAGGMNPAQFPHLAALAGMQMPRLG